MDYEVVTPELLDGLTEEDARMCLWVSAHPQLQKRWIVEAFDPTYRHKLKKVVGPYLDVMPLHLQDLLDAARDWNYRVLFKDDPGSSIAWVEGLSQHPGVELLSDMPGTIGGMLPFQVQAVNFAKGQDAVYYNMSTGSGKSIVEFGTMMWRIAQQDVDVVIHVVKKHNKINLARACERFTGVKSTIVGGTKKKRTEVLEDALSRVFDGEVVSVVCNYETFKHDTQAWKDLVVNKRVLVYFDEMPTKLKNNQSATYRGVCEVFFTSYHEDRGKRYYYPEYGKWRSSTFTPMALSATPLENHPGDFFEQMAILDSRVFGDRADFYREYSSGQDKFGNQRWINTKIPHIGRRASHMVFQVDKSDPDIAVQFPEVVRETLWLDLHEDDQRIYDALVKEYDNMRHGTESMLSFDELLAVCSVMSMICCNTQSVLLSADMREWWREEGMRLVSVAEELAHSASTKAEKKAAKAAEDAAWKHAADAKGGEIAAKLVDKVGRDKFDDMSGSTIRSQKVQALYDLLEGGSKAVVFTRLNDMMVPRLSELLTQFGISHVTYRGGMTDKQKQLAQDTFKQTDCQVFLSTDAGSDSIDLEESALAIHFDIPDKWSTMTQRENRIHRITSKHSSVRFVTLAINRSYEQRRLENVAKKQGYHDGVFRGQVAEVAQTMRKAELLWELFGDQD